MDRDTIKTMLAAILERSVGESVGVVEETTSLKADLNLDSIDFVAMSLEVQSDFNIELKERDFPSMVLVKDLIDLIQSRLPSTESKAA